MNNDFSYFIETQKTYWDWDWEFKPFTKMMNNII